MTGEALDLTTPDGPVPAEGPVDWALLDQFPRCVSISWCGPERGLIDAVAARPGIRFLEWSDAEGDLDLRRTHLDTVRLDGARLRGVRLPRAIGTLLLRRPPAGLTVEAPDEGHGLDLRLFQYGPDIVIPQGLRRTPTVWLWAGGALSAEVLSPLRELADLTLTFDAAPGDLTDLPLLARHDRLHTLHLDDAFGLDPGALPDLPALRRLVLAGTRRTTAAALGERFPKRGPVALEVSGAKSRAWLAAHLDNPFRDWVEESKVFGKAACAAYTRAWRAIDAVVPGSPDGPVAAERALRGLVADLNAVHDTHGPIDTLYREEAWEAFRELAGRAGLPEARVDGWFEEGRRF
jgi:hypothetical protein